MIGGESIMARNLIITGMSGAGKTQVMRTLEDLGYFCVDNLPPTFIPKFIELCMKRSDESDQLALAADIRGGKFFDELTEVLDQLSREKIPFELVFLDADDQTLVRRYKETRRRHPLAGKGGLSADIARERQILSHVRRRATTIIDTTHTTTKELRAKIISLYGRDGSLPAMSIAVQSFGFKHGIPIEADLVFDVRFMPNPYYVPELKNKTGLDQAVRDFVFSFRQTNDFMEQLEKMLTFLLPLYAEEGKSALVIAIGCTGGHHRSVAVAHELAEYITEEGYQVTENHRDISR